MGNLESGRHNQTEIPGETFSSEMMVRRDVARCGRYGWVSAVAWGMFSFSLPAVALAQGTGAVPIPVYSPQKKELPRTLPTVLQSRVRYGETPALLEEASRSAYLRGLMPLDSRLKYLALARDARLSGSDITPEQSIEAWNHYRNQLAELVPQIRRLNQPGATNWASELAWSKYAVIQADQRIAQIQGDQSTFEQATGMLQQASQQLFRQSAEDYSLGLATLLDVTIARDRFLESNQSSPVNRMSALAATNALHQQWNLKGAEIGRQDRILESQLTQNLLTFQTSLGQGDVSQISQSLTALHQTGHRHFQTTYQYYQHGTAPLHQLTSSIMLRQRLQNLEQDFPELQNKASTERFQQDWQLLKNAAARTSDRRGRVAADVIAIELLAVSIEN